MKSSFGLGLLVGQKKQYEDVELVLLHIDEMINWLTVNELNQ